METNITDSLADNLIRLLPLLHGTVVNLDDFNTDSDLGRAHYEILAFLESAENEFSIRSVPMSGISKAMNISKPYLTTLVDRLISKEYVERIPDPDDRRIIKIALTQTGGNLIKEHFVLMRNAVVERLAGLDSEEINELSCGLQTVTGILEKVRGEGMK